MYHSYHGNISIWSPYPFEGITFYARSFSVLLQNYPGLNIHHLHSGYSEDTMDYLNKSSLVIVLADLDLARLTSHVLYAPLKCIPHVLILCRQEHQPRLSLPVLTRNLRLDTQSTALLASDSPGKNNLYDNTGFQNALAVILKSLERIFLYPEASGH